MDNKYRYDFYTNNIFNDNQKYIIKIPQKYLSYQQNKPLLYRGNHPEILNKDFKYFVVTDDGYHNDGLPCFQKTRLVKNYSKFSILLKLTQNRQWGIFYSKQDKISWSSKKDLLVWRGAATGKGDRITLCSKYNQKYDIGFSKIFQHQKNLSNLLKNTLEYKDFTEYKFLLSIDGNDKDSGLNWKLATNSVVLMKEPVFDSWLMDSHLKPWVHYIPLSDNFEDLDQKYEWCLSYDSKCRAISENANAFMEKFKNIENEKKISNMIEKQYSKYIELI
jgi:hypothetical protein